MTYKHPQVVDIGSRVSDMSHSFFLLVSWSSGGQSLKFFGGAWEKKAVDSLYSAVLEKTGSNNYALSLMYKVKLSN